ncbi:ribonuclease H-like domain, reverse transcriptase, RNA-dependent DNA polymerase [Tanacetum coccineum]
MIGCNETLILMDPGTRLTKNTEGTLVNSTEYRSLIACLRYLLHTRPELSYSVGLLSRFMQEPREQHMKAIRQVLRYVKGKKDYGITYKHNGGDKIHGFSDSSYGVNTQEGKVTTGIIFYYGESPISWSTQKQATVALSSCESEFIAAIAATQALWLKRLLSKLTHSKEEKVTIMVDNKYAIALMKNPVFHGRSKHIDTKYHFMRECVEREDIQVEFIYDKAIVIKEENVGLLPIYWKIKAVMKVVINLVVYDTEVDTHEGNRNINIRKRKVPEKEGSRRKMVDRKVKGQNVGELHKDADMGVENIGDEGVVKNSVHKQKLVIHNEKGKKKVVTKANCKRNNGKKNVGARTKHDVDRVHIRVSLWSLHRLIPNLSSKQREDVIDMGFGAVLGFKIKDVPTRLSYWLLDNFHKDACILNVNGKAISITRETVKDVLGLPMGSVYVEARDEADFRHPLVVEWKRQFGKKHRYYHGPVEHEMIRQQVAGGWLFKLNFLVLYFTSIGESNKNATVNLKFLQCIADEHDIPNFDWCSYIVECLVRTKKSWVRTYHYTGPVIVLLILYAYSIRPRTEYEEAELPLVNNWTVEMLNQLEQERFSPTNVEIEPELMEAEKELFYLPSLSSTDDLSSILLLNKLTMNIPLNQ